MINEIEKHELSNEKTFPYFFENIECGKILSKRVVETIPFQNGSFFTILPFNADTTRLYEFSQGGIIKSIPYGEKEYKISRFSENFHPQQVITMDRECVTFIASYLQKKTTNYAIIENYMAKPNGVFTSIRGVKTPCHREDVYYILDNNSSEDQILEAIRKSNAIWHSVCVLTNSRFGAMEENIELTDEKILEICTHCSLIKIGAYDGEAYIFWERNNSQLIQ